MLFDELLNTMKNSKLTFIIHYGDDTYKVRSKKELKDSRLRFWKVSKFKIDPTYNDFQIIVDLVEGET